MSSPASHIAMRIVKPLASLRLTVTLFGLSIFLIFAGTGAQVELGIWAVMEQYFRTAIAWIDVDALLLGVTDTGLAFPFPGGWIIGGLLLVNLIAAHLTRFRLSWKRSGILLIHSGLIVLILSEFVTGLYAEEGQMTIYEGGASNFIEDIREVELAIVDKSDPRFDEVHAIPQSRLDPGRTIEDPSLPLTIEVLRYMPNSVLMGEAGAGGDLPNPANRGDGTRLVAAERPVVAGAEADQRVDTPSAYVRVAQAAAPDGGAAGTYLVSTRLQGPQHPQVVEHGGRTYHLYLRFKRQYLPFAMHLIDFRHDKYLGTDKPKNFSSRLRLVDPGRGENREVLIRMNEPLRYAGLTMYQAAFKPGDTGTVLQVVHNPGWLMPYVSCGLITLGLVVQFTLSLERFLGRGLSRKLASPPVSTQRSAA